MDEKQTPPQEITASGGLTLPLPGAIVPTEEKDGDDNG